MNIQGFSPTIMAPTLGASATAATSSSSSASSSSGTGTSSTSLQTTFLNLLVTELQNQDPTSPVDPTAMVGQMVSLNQLDQLISINQTLQNLSTSGSTTAGTQSKPAANANAVLPQTKTNATATNTPAMSSEATAAVLQALGATTGAAGNSGLMNLYGSVGLPTVNPYPTYTGAK